MRSPNTSLVMQSVVVRSVDCTALGQCMRIVTLKGNTKNEAIQLGILTQSQSRLKSGNSMQVVHCNSMLISVWIDRMCKFVQIDLQTTLCSSAAD